MTDHAPTTAEEREKWRDADFFSPNSYKRIICRLADEVDRLTAEKQEATRAIKPVLAAVKESSAILGTDRDSWNPDAHVEITITAQEIWNLADAIAKDGAP